MPCKYHAQSLLKEAKVRPGGVQSIRPHLLMAAMLTAADPGRSPTFVVGSERQRGTLDSLVKREQHFAEQYQKLGRTGGHTFQVACDGGADPTNLSKKTWVLGQNKYFAPYGNW